MNGDLVELCNRVLEPLYRYDALLEEPEGPTPPDYTFYVPARAYLLEFFATETSGASIGHTGGLARVDFD